MLATNVAETSLTVPGIRYVVDPGTARISRYSARLKVQRLPIEPVSQASADQRKGRCGRTADGICIRMYSEEDFDARPRFTDPEILRTSLAAVLLQMAVAGLGDIEDFPFLDPPDRRQVRDAVTLLQELAAFGPSKELTPLGRRLAGLPVDPRMGRMVLEADRVGCAAEVIIIAAGLSIQDPRERPAEGREEADALHARFADPSSDFLSLLNLWNFVRERQRELTGNQFRKRLRAEHLHVLRVREWQDLVSQLRQAAKAAGVHPNHTPAEPDEIHAALLAGLLSHIGLRDPRRRDYQGARGARFQIFPGSVLARRQPDWAMVAELVETSRLWGRTAAKIDPAWIEPLAGHLVRRMYDDPVLGSQAGLGHGAGARHALRPAGRRGPQGRLRAPRPGPLARAVHPQGARRARLADPPRVLRRQRPRAGGGPPAGGPRAPPRHPRRGPGPLRLLRRADPRAASSPARTSTAGGATRAAATRTCSPTRASCSIDPAAAAGLAERGWPATWRQGELELELSYRFEPGAPDDGVTAHIPLRALGAVRADRFEWLVPALRRELLTALLRSLPKDLRRPLVPVPEVVEQVLERLEPRRRPLLEDVTRALAELRGVQVPPEAWDLSRLPDHLRMRFVVDGPDGEVLAAARDLDALREELRPRLRAELATASAGLERTGMRGVGPGGASEDHRAAGNRPGGPRVSRARGRGGDRRRADPRHARGAGSGDARRHAAPAGARDPVATACGARPARLLRGAHARGRAARQRPGGARRRAGRCDRRARRGGRWPRLGCRRLRAAALATSRDASSRSPRSSPRRMVAVLDAARDVRLRLDAARGAQLREVRDDVERQLARLVPAGFATAAGAGRIADLERYLRGAARRLDRLPDGLGADLQKMAVVHELEALAAGRPDLDEVPWLLEELRVSLFAEALGVRGQVSAKRIRRLLAEVLAAALASLALLAPPGWAPDTGRLRTRSRPPVRARSPSPCAPSGACGDARPTGSCAARAW